MRTVKIPDTDLTVSAICMGSGEFGSSVKQDQCFELLDLFHSKGGTFLDTALVYGDWAPDIERHASEKVIGRWIEDRGVRKNIILGTKGGLPRIPDPERKKRCNPKGIAEDIDTSLEDLRTDCIDLYWLHTDNPEEPVEGLIDTLEDAVRKGKIRHYGASNWHTPRMIEAQAYAKKSRAKGFVADQILWNAAPLSQHPYNNPGSAFMSKERYEYHVNSKMAMIPYQSQAYGLFNRMYNGTLDQMNKGFRAFYRAEESAQVFERMKKVMEDTGLVSITQTVLGYLMSQPEFMTVPIFSCRTTAQLADSVLAGDVKLSAEQVRYIDNGMPWSEPLS
jgi:aryl-alcohol dehydrogenase-like predicted oxidoreductase